MSKLTLNQKISEIVIAVSPDAQRLFLLSDAIARGDADDTQLAVILGRNDVARIGAAKREFQVALQAWNTANDALEQAKK
jgi:hypothetical protein